MPSRARAGAGRPARRPASMLVAACGLASVGLIALPAAVPAGAALAARSPAGGAAPPAVPALSAVGKFVARPQVAPPGSGLEQACATPSRPGQMACMALIRPGTRRAGPDPASPSGYAPQDLLAAYGLASAAAKPGNGEMVAVVDAFSDPDAESDLAQYRSKFGLPACTTASDCLAVTNEFGGTKLPKADPTGGWALEESLDLDMVSAICPNCKIVLIEADSASISDLSVAERTASRIPGMDAVTNSWGSGAEFIGENQFDPDFYAPGIAIAAAGGDGGYGTQYPAASPFVTAVGGTTLRGSGSSWTQSAWNGVGSGCSSLEPKPSWQTADARSPDGCLNRTMNDVSADADPSTGVAIYDSVKDSALGGVPGWTMVGGTSVATPVIAATYALADTSAGGPGTALIPGTFPAAYPYQASSGLTDVAGGSNGSCESARQYLCNAVPGYDGPTGLGTPSGLAAFTVNTSREVTIADPGTMVVAAGAKLNLALNYEPGTLSPAFSTTPASLPGSLFVDAGGTLQGSAPTVPGVYPITITATDPTLGSGSTTFDIVVLPSLKAAHPGTGELKLAGGGRCLTAVASPVRIEKCVNHPNQKWEFVPGGSLSGAGQLKDQGKCLATGSGSGNGALATVQACSKSTRQRWVYAAGGHLRNVSTGRCLAIRGSATAGKQAVERTCSGPGLAWLLPAAPVVSAVPGRCLNDPGASGTAGTRIVVSACSTARGQRWTAETNGTLAAAGKCLSVSNSSMLHGAAIVLARCGNGSAQTWLRGPDGELMDAHSGLCLADPGNSKVSGTKLVQNDCYRQPGEIWVIS
jgi:Ricin-type beta-trefoil lectin domain/Putative Ig domain